MLSWPTKDPEEVLDYQLDWSDRLETGETISVSNFTIVEGTVVKDSQSVAGGLTTVWLSGGTLGEMCLITNRITTNQGRVYDESVRLRVRAS